VIADCKSAQIVATAFSYGSKHDFQLFKDAGGAFVDRLRILADAGYRGLTALHPNSQTPFKKSKHHPLTTCQKQSNCALARQRIFSERYCNRKQISFALQRDC
jgi:hypothetical protein